MGSKSKSSPNFEELILTKQCDLKSRNEKMASILLKQAPVPELSWPVPPDEGSEADQAVKVGVISKLSVMGSTRFY